MKYGLTKKEITELKTVFENFGLHHNKLLIFGSRAKGTFRYNSDIDLVYMGKITTKQRMLVIDYLEEETLLPYKFDLLAYDEIKNEKLKEHIDRVAGVL